MGHYAHGKWGSMHNYIEILGKHGEWVITHYAHGEWGSMHNYIGGEHVEWGSMYTILLYWEIFQGGIFLLFLFETLTMQKVLFRFYQ